MKPLERTVLKINQQDARETIFALASAPGRAGIAIMRLSGPASKAALQALTQKPPPPARRAVLRTLFDDADDKLDSALVFCFDAPASFSGEDMAELHLHGSTAVVEAVSLSLFALGLEQAAPGEFTRRAFQNGKMDLTEAEGLADLIDAQSKGQRKQALAQMQGGLRDVYENWRSQIIDALAFVEGEIDFPDEDDIPDALALRAGPGLDKLAQQLRTALAGSGRGERVRHGVQIAIIGAPNVGKSSIINHLAGRDVAIVSPEAGTTRDIIEVQIELAGQVVRVCDTAGLRQTDNAVEAEGVRRANLRADEADLKLLVIDGSQVEDIAAHKTLLSRLQDGDLVIYNKSDLPEFRTDLNVSRETFCVSAITGEGFDDLITHLEKTIQGRFGAGEQAGLTRARHKTCVEQALRAIENACRSIGVAPELAGADLRLALHSLKELAGETDIEAVLDRVFSSFCIGK